MYGSEYAIWEKLLTKDFRIATRREKGPTGYGKQDVKAELNILAAFCQTVKILY